MYTPQAERELLLKERKARIEAEREKEELMKRLQQYEAEAKAANQALVGINAQFNTITLLTKPLIFTITYIIYPIVILLYKC